MRAKGFTLIELVVVIVILGILAATALPKFVDFKGDAAKAAAEGVAGALSSGTALNYGKYQISSGAAGVVTITGASACTSAVSTLQGAALPTNYTTTLASACTNGVASCSVIYNDGSTSATAAANITCTN